MPDLLRIGRHKDNRLSDHAALYVLHVQLRLELPSSNQGKTPAIPPPFFQQSSATITVLAAAAVALSGAGAYDYGVLVVFSLSFIVKYYV